MIYAKEESNLEIKCLSETGKREVRELPIKGFKKVSIEKNCMGVFNEELLYSDSNFESDNKNYWLPIETDFENDFEKTLSRLRWRKNSKIFGKYAQKCTAQD